MEALEDRIEKYLASGGGNCPVCGKDNIEGSSVEIDSGIASQEIFCNDCESSWTDQYTLTGYADLKIEGEVDKVLVANSPEVVKAQGRLNQDMKSLLDNTALSAKPLIKIGEDRPEGEASDIEIKPLNLTAAEVLERFEQRNPKWLKASMTVERAAQLARTRGCTLRAQFDPVMGLTIIATRARRESDT